MTTTTNQISSRVSGQITRVSKSTDDVLHSSRNRLTEPRVAANVLKVAEHQSERAAAFQLIHRAYLQSGLTVDNEMQMRVTNFHLLNTTDLMVAKQNDRVNATATLVRDGELGLPLESLFGDEIQSMRATGIKLAEISCLANSGGEDKKQQFESLVKMISLTFQVARRRGIDRMVMVVHPRHARIYQRLFGCVPCSDVKQYAAVQGNPAVMCRHDFAELDVRRYPLYDKIYGDRFAPWQLDGTHMSDAEKLFFHQAVPDHCCDMVPMAA